MNERTIGPTILATINLLFGALGALGAAIFLSEGGHALSVGSSIGSAGGDADLGTAFTVGGGSMIAQALVGLAGFGAMSVGALGLFARANWGRLASIFAAAMIITLTVWRSTKGDLQTFNWITMGYAIAQAAAMFIPAWKAQFIPPDAEPIGAENSGEQLRRAA